MKRNFSAKVASMECRAPPSTKTVRHANVCNAAGRRTAIHSGAVLLTVCADQLSRSLCTNSTISHGTKPGCLRIPRASGARTFKSTSAHKTTNFVKEFLSFAEPLPTIPLYAPSKSGRSRVPAINYANDKATAKEEMAEFRRLLEPDNAGRTGSPEEVFNQLWKLVNRAKEGRFRLFIDHSLWREAMRLVSYGPPHVAGPRVTAVFDWKLEMGAPVLMKDLVTLLRTTYDERKSVADVDRTLAKLDNARAQFSPTMFVHIFWGLIKQKKSGEVARFFERYLADDRNRLMWQPAFFDKTIDILLNTWHRHYDSVTAEDYNATDLAELETHVEKAMRQLLVQYSSVMGDGKVSARHYNILAKVPILSLRNYESAALFLQRMEVEGFEPDWETVAHLGERFIAADNHHALATLLKDAAKRGLEGNENLDPLRFWLNCRQGDITELKQWFKDRPQSVRVQILLKQQRVLTLLFERFIREEQPAAALELAQLFVSKQVFPQRILSQMLVRQLLALDDYHEANAYMDLLLQSFPYHLSKSPTDRPVTKEMFWDLIEQGLVRKDLPRVMHLYNRLRELKDKPSLRKVTPILEYAIRNGFDMEAHAILQNLHLDGHQADTYVYILIIERLVKQKKWDDINGVLQRMARKGIEPNQYVFNIVCQGLLREGMLDQYEYFRSKMETKGVVPDMVSANIELTEHVRAGRTEEALRMWETVKEIKSYGEVTFTIMAGPLWRLGRHEEVERVYEELSKRPDATQTVFTTMMRVYSHHGRGSDSVLRVFNDMKRLENRRHTPLVGYHAYRSVVLALVEENKLDLAEEYVDEALATLPAKDLVNTGLASPLLRAVAEQTGDMDAVKRLINKITAHLTVLDGYLFANIIAVYTSAREFAEAIPWVQRARFEAHDAGTNANLMNAVLDWYAKQGRAEDMERVYGEMRRGVWAAEANRRTTVVAIPAAAEERVPPPRPAAVEYRANNHTFNIFIDGYGYAGEWQNALDLFTKMLVSPADPKSARENFDPSLPPALRDAYTSQHWGVDHRTVSLILDALGWSAQLTPLDTTWKQLKKLAFPFDTNNYTSRLEALMRCGMFDEVVTILARPPPTLTMDAKTLRNVLSLVPACARARISGSATRSTAADAKQTLLERRMADTLWKLYAKKYPALVPPVRAGLGSQMRKLGRVEAVIESSRVRNEGGAARVARRVLEEVGREEVGRLGKEVGLEFAEGDGDEVVSGDVASREAMWGMLGTGVARGVGGEGSGVGEKA
ncbi:uncharacterized protein EV422DRAFT_578864 [Fimicolochytrium jonesii]|uniref:uncharacterized protein n=1 Tax=Fimicolochytrium jonesii TaxID=1396493 RepID=UPI0022FDDEEF|nr:uncharacterized protein EV422DRAFT_578864 [Fimicolochytrium jonesii]KAI8820579.1 hypothetical protein EV422DRAFT_578864 [Fimicolochytrium jonesii]